MRGGQVVVKVRITVAVYASCPGTLVFCADFNMNCVISEVQLHARAGSLGGEVQITVAVCLLPRYQASRSP